MAPPSPRGIFAAAAVLFALAPTALSGQLLHRNFGMQCTTSSFRACASVSAWNEVDQVTGDYNLFVRVSNVQGTAGYESLRAAGLGAWVFDNLGLHYPAVDPYPGTLDYRASDFSPYNGVADGSGIYECQPNGVNCVQIAGGGAAAGGAPWIWETPGSVELITSLYDNPGLLWGCDVAQEPSIPFHQEWAVYYSSCNGSVTYRMTLGFGAGLVLTPQTTVGLSFYTTDPGGNIAYAECGPNGPSSVSNAACSTITPEPVTMVLLGSGLFAMGGAGALRRKRREEEEPGEA